MNEAVICTKCGCATEQEAKPVQTTSGYVTAAKVFMVIGTVLSGFYVIPLLWCLPMTIAYFKKTGAGKRVSVGFKICSTLFVSLIGGLLMFGDNR